MVVYPPKVLSGRVSSISVEALTDTRATFWLALFSYLALLKIAIDFATLSPSKPPNGSKFVLVCEKRRTVNEASGSRASSPVGRF